MAAYFHGIKVLCYCNFMASKLQNISVSWHKSFMLSEFQGIVVACYQISWSWWTFISGADSSSSSSSSSLLLAPSSAIWLPSLSFPFPSLKKIFANFTLSSLFHPKLWPLSPPKDQTSSRRDLASGGLKPSEGNLRGTSHSELSNPSNPNWQYVTDGETQIHSISSWSLWWAKATHLWFPGLMTLMTNRRYTIHATIYSPSSWPTYGCQGSWRCHGLMRATLVGSLMLLIASWEEKLMLSWFE